MHGLSTTILAWPPRRRTRPTGRVGILVSSLLLAAATVYAEPRVLLVQGTTSTPTAAERNYAATLTRTFQRWLDEAGVAYRVAQDGDIARQVPEGIRVAVLVYNPRLSDEQKTTLERFIGRGGRLLVFYSSDPELAALMGFRLGDYQAAPAGKGWTVIRAAPGAPAYLPREVRQQSRHRRPVYPAGPQSRVMAWWNDTGSKGGPEPAVVTGPAGLWMTHVLLDDGDTANKKRLLIALLATCDPALWPDASAGALRAAGRVGSFRHVADALKAITAAADASGRPAAQGPVREVVTQYQELLKLHERGEYQEVVARAGVLQNTIVDAYALTQVPRSGERRWVWDHAGTGLYPGDWPRTCRRLAESGLTDVLPNVLWPGEAHYAGEGVRPSYISRVYGDQVSQCLAAARATGLRVHAWKVCWRLDRADPEWVRQLRVQKRLQVSDTGQTLPWLCPSHPDNRRLEKDAVRDLLRRYAVDGVHLDYIRYPDSHACYCEGCRERFGQHVGRVFTRWPQEVREGAMQVLYQRWRAGQITALVRDVSALARAARPGIQVSAAVYGRYPLCVASVGQDWGQWLEEGLIDYACPMNYTTNLAAFTSWTHGQLALPGGRRGVLPGIGATATESRLDAVMVLEQIAAARAEGAAGFAIFDLNGVLESEILPALRKGATAPSPKALP